MISFVIGKIDYIGKNSVIINNNDIGYEIKTSDSTINKIIKYGTSEKIKLYTFTCFKEDSISLFGFLAFDELMLFNHLITVSGIGPKAAMNILAFFSVNDISFAIASEDINLLSKIPGIGKKTAQRLVLELKDKINAPTIKNKNEVENNECTDAIEALCSLGYNRSDIIKIIMSMQIKNLSTQKIIKLALKSLAK